MIHDPNDQVRKIALIPKQSFSTNPTQNKQKHTHYQLLIYPYTTKPPNNTLAYTCYTPIVLLNSTCYPTYSTTTQNTKHKFTNTPLNQKSGINPSHYLSFGLPLADHKIHSFGVEERIERKEEMGMEVVESVWRSHERERG